MDILRNKNGFICDMDGVLYHGNHLLDGAKKFVDWLKAENKDKLTAILTYHVVPGRVLAKDVVKLEKATTVQGEAVKITVKKDKVMINGAQVVMTDIVADNGVIHVIDSVILPPKGDESAE